MSSSRMNGANGSLIIFKCTHIHASDANIINECWSFSLSFVSFPVYVSRVYRITCLVNVLHLPMCYHHLCIYSECNYEDVYVWLSTGNISDGIFNRIILDDNIRAEDTHTMWNYFLFVCVRLWDAICSLFLPINYSYDKREQSPGFIPLSNFRLKKCVYVSEKWNRLTWILFFLSIHQHVYMYIYIWRLDRHKEK